MTERPVVPVAVSCAVVRDRAVLLVKRGNEPAKGRWAFPGGRLNPGETMAEGIAREVMEESGIVVGEPRFLMHYETIGWEGRRITHHFVICVHAAEAVGDAVPVAGDDADEALFVPLDRLPDYDVVPSCLRALEALGALPLPDTEADTEA